MSSPRDTVRKNLIWNPISAPTYISVVATVISVVALVVSFYSARTARTQTEIQRRNSLPEIDIVETLEPGLNNELYSSITIKNMGGALTNPKLEKITFLRVSWSSPAPRGFLAIPVQGYYYKPVYTGRSKGILVSLRWGNHNKVDKLIADCLAQDCLKNGILPVSMETFLKITYSDGARGSTRLIL